VETKIPKPPVVVVVAAARVHNSNYLGSRDSATGMFIAGPRVFNKTETIETEKAFVNNFGGAYYYILAGACGPELRTKTRARRRVARGVLRRTNKNDLYTPSERVVYVIKGLLLLLSRMLGISIRLPADP